MITVSIVSHAHGKMVNELVKKLLEFELISKIIITFNIPEKIKLIKNSKIKIIFNRNKKGFGANHNQAFQHCESKYFCVMNPDIKITKDPFPDLIKQVVKPSFGVCAPMVYCSQRSLQATWRSFPSPKKILKKALGEPDSFETTTKTNSITCPDWIAGMFMIFRSEVYTKTKGFDEKYFLYYEDVDICFRLKLLGYLSIGCYQAEVIHDAQRDSHKRLNYFIWHISGMIRFFIKRAIYSIRN